MQGRILAGRYRLIAELGHGGMGSVWQAEHLTLHTRLAIKLMNPQVAESPGALSRFQREALSAAELRSAHIVHVTDYGVDDGTPFIAMELLEGESLADRLKRTITLSPDETLRLLTQVCRALTVAHDKGVVHRDLKPDNIFIISEAGEESAKVLDFGVAKRADALSLNGELVTQSGMLLGTPYYMSPEQINSRGNLDGRSDIWSLGVIAYECLTGHRPFVKQSLGDLLMTICQETPLKPSQIASVPAGFDEWFARATNRDLAVRFATAAEAATALSVLVRGTMPPASPSTSAARPTLPTATVAVLPENWGANAELPSDVLGPAVSPESVIASAVTNKHTPQHPRKRIYLVAVVPVLALGAIGYWIARQTPATASRSYAATSGASTLVTPVPMVSSAQAVTVTPVTASSTGVAASPALTTPPQIQVNPANAVVEVSQPSEPHPSASATRAPSTAAVPSTQARGKRRGAVVNHAGF
jgi:serine/threonine-protein kinase